MAIKNKIQLRRGNGTQWTLSNNGEGPILASGEPGFDITNNQLKIGDGINSWANLIPVNYNLNNYSIVGTGNINIDGNILANSGSFDKIIFNEVGDPDLSIRQLAWNETEGSLALALTDKYAMFLGGELHYRVKNSTNSTLLSGTPVYASGLSSGINNRIEVAPYVADGSVREIRFMGLVTESFNSGDNGFTTHFGYIRGLDTRGNASINGTTNKLWAENEPQWEQGDILYVHPSVPGKLTKIEPIHSISVAIILSINANQGKLFVRPTTFGHLEDNHDVSYSGLVDNNFLVWNSGLNMWKPSTDLFYVDGKLGIGADNPTYKLEVDGSFSATTKSFKIKHPSKQRSILEYGSLESPYHGVRLTGRGKLIKGVGVVELPYYLKDLIYDDETINIQITNIKHSKTIYLDCIDLQNDKFIVKADRSKTLGELHFCWTLTGIRKDVENLVVEREQ
jgi:hypothetical protein